MGIGGYQTFQGNGSQKFFRPGFEQPVQCASERVIVEVACGHACAKKHFSTLRLVKLPHPGEWQSATKGIDDQCQNMLTWGDIPLLLVPGNRLIDPVDQMDFITKMFDETGWTHLEKFSNRFLHDLHIPGTKLATMLSKNECLRDVQQKIAERKILISILFMRSMGSIYKLKGAGSGWRGC